MWTKDKTVNTIEDVIERNTGLSIKEFLKEEKPEIEMDKFVTDISKLLDKDYVPVIIGDYDVDGIMASLILYKSFEKLSANKPMVFLPNRFSEGYGFSEKLYDRIKKSLHKNKKYLFITVDNGITASETIGKARKDGIKVFVTDHHTPLKDESGEQIIPECDGIICNKIEKDEDLYSDINMCGAGIAYVTALNLFKEMGLEYNTDELLTYAALATVADVMPLVKSNRYIVKEGINKLLSGKSGLVFNELFKDLGFIKSVSSEDIAFFVAPRINACSRLSDTGATELFEKIVNAKTIDEAKAVVEFLNSNNDDRKNFQSWEYEEILDDAKEKFDKKSPLIIYKENLSKGLIGILAARLTEDFNVPALVFTSEDGKKLSGSARSVGDFNIFSIFEPHKDLFLSFGGHAGAFGCSIDIDNLETLKKAVKGTYKAPKTKDIYDLDLNEKDIKKTIEILKKYEPYGEANPDILFRLKINLENAKVEKNTSGNLKITLADKSVIRAYNLKSEDDKETSNDPKDKFVDVKNTKDLDLICTLREKIYFFRGKEFVKSEIMFKDFTKTLDKNKTKEEKSEKKSTMDNWKGKVKDWKNEPLTKKQKKYIFEMDRTF